MISVIIVDDEEDARFLIRQYLSQYPDYQVVAEAHNGLQAVELIHAHQPELVFLDIQMPGLNGFETLRQLNVLPQIIFSTAYDTYALQAFEVHAIDYLLKPYDQKRFAQTMAGLAAQQQKLLALAQQLVVRPHSYPLKIILQKGHRQLFVLTEQIVRIAAYGDYCKVQVGKETLLANSGISAMEQRLDPQHFVRVHRSTIVNLQQTLALQKTGRYYELLLHNQERVRVGERYLTQVKALIH